MIKAQVQQLADLGLHVRAGDGNRTRTIRLGMSVIGWHDQPFRRSVRILNDPLVTVNPRARPTHRASIGHNGSHRFPKIAARVPVIQCQSANVRSSGPQPTLANRSCYLRICERIKKLSLF